MAIKAYLELAAILHLFSIQSDHEVSGFQPDSLRSTSRQNVGNNNTVFARQIQPRRQHRSHCLRTNPNVTTPHAAVLPDLFVNGSNDIARRRKPEPLTAARLGGDQCIDSHKLPAHL